MTNKYINIDSFIDLSKDMSDSFLLTYLSINLSSNHLHFFNTKSVYKILHFYSQKQIKKAFKYLEKENYIIKTNIKNQYLLLKKFKKLTYARNNLFKIEIKFINKYQKNTILFYKYKIFEKLCQNLLIKQKNIEKYLNIKRYEIRKFEKLFNLKTNKQVLKIKGLTKWTVGIYDRNIKNSKYFYSSLPNYYEFKKTKELVLFKINFDYIIEKRKYIIFGLKQYEKSCEKSKKSKSDSTDDLNRQSQLFHIYTKLIEQPKKYMFIIEKQLTNLYPYFVHRNKFTEIYNYKSIDLRLNTLSR